MPTFTGIHHVTLTVTDLERSTGWYIRVMGFERGPEIADQDGRGEKRLLLQPGTAFRLVLVRHAANQGGGSSEFVTGLDHLAFGVSHREELETWDRHLTACEVEHSPIKEGITGWLFTFRDPDNIQLEMYTIGK